MKAIIAIFCFVIFSITAYSQTGGLYGEIIDVSSGKPLVGANIYLQNTKTGAATIKDGKYIINKIEPGTYDVVSNYLGYKTVVVKDVKIEAGKKNKLDLALPRDNNFHMPEKREKFYLEQIPAEAKSKLNEIKKINKEEYFRSLQEIYFDNLINKQEKRGELFNDIMNLDLQKKLYVLKYKLAQSPGRRAKIREALRNSLSNLFEKNEEKRKQEIDDAKRKINHLDSSMMNYRKNKGEIIEKQINELLNSNQK